MSSKKLIQPTLVSLTVDRHRGDQENKEIENERNDNQLVSYTRQMELVRIGHQLITKGIVPSP